MTLQLTWWSWLGITIVSLILLNHAFKFILWCYGFFATIIYSKPINLKERFGHWAVITGSTDGIGKEYAKELARHNLNIVLVSRSMDKLNATKDELLVINPEIQVLIIQADFSRGKADTERIRNQLKDVPVGILVNNVGIITEYPMYFEEIPENTSWDLVNVNIGSMILMTRLVIDGMKKRGKGAIVNLSSAAGCTPMPLMSIYGASKTFISYFSRAIHAEYEASGIIVQCLTPSYINTKMIGYSERIQNFGSFVPDPETYAKNACRTLGRLNCTTGYWLHDVMNLFLLLPETLRTKTIFFINSSERNIYLARHKIQHEQ